MESDYITYEQPLSELMRVCLRLEQLFDKITLLKDNTATWQTQVLMTALIDILVVLDRPDLKGKLTKALNRLIEKLAPLMESNAVDHHYLQSLLCQIDEHLLYLLNTHGKLAQSLRDSDLLSDLKQHHSSLGGPFCMDTPGYHYWLQLPAAHKTMDINNWLCELKPMESIVQLILQLARGSKEPTGKVAENGFYHQALNPKDNLRLIRIHIPKSVQAYPEISVGPHRVNIRWYSPKSDERAAPIEHDVPFDITYCN